MKKKYKHLGKFKDEQKRLNRVIGQVEGIRNMLSEERLLSAVLTQCKATRSALKAIEQRLLESYLDICLDEILMSEKKKTKAQKIEEISEIFKHN